MKHFTILSNTVLVVELDETPVRLTVNMGYLIAKVDNKSNWVSDAVLANPCALRKYLENHKEENDYKDVAFKLPEGDWRYLGPLTSISGGVLAGWVEKVDRSGLHGYASDKYKGYATPYDDVDTAHESLLSAIRAAGWYIENPYEGKEPTWVTCISNPDKIKEWERKYKAAQQRVINAENTHIFKVKE